MVIILILGSFEIIQIGVAFNEKVFVNFLNVLNIDFFIFILSIIYFIYATKNKKIFDKMIGIYYTGKLPNFTEENKANISHLSQIYALQIIWKKSGKNLCYELNIVLKNATRIHVINQCSIIQLRVDAMVISNFLDVPLWDTTIPLAASSLQPLYGEYEETYQQA